MEAKLLVVGGKTSKDVIPLTLPTVLGRSREAKLTIVHPMISRRHCRLFEKDGLLMIEDLGSLNGTLVAGQRVKETPLPPNGEFTVGPLTFRAEYDYTGDLSKLPPTVFDEQESDAGERPAANGQVPDFTDVEESPVNDLPVLPTVDGSDDDFAFLGAAGSDAMRLLAERETASNPPAPPANGPAKAK